MKLSTIRPRRLAAFALGAVATAGLALASLAAAQQNGAPPGDTARHVLALPSVAAGSGALQIEKIAPKQVKLGEPYQYQIRVQNLTDAPLANVVVYETLGPGVQLESAQPSARPANRASPARQNQNQNRQATDRVAERPRQADESQADGGQAKGQDEQQDKAQPAAGRSRRNADPDRQADETDKQAERSTTYRWDVGDLQPKATQTIQVTAVANREGQAPTCVTASYQPALCSFVNVVSPNLKVTKSGPRQVLLCEPITYTYAVSNTGSGTADNVVLRDQLPDGLQTADGKRQLEIPIGAIPAGQTKQQQVQLHATRAGMFTSRAVASSASDKAASDAVTTAVREPKLALDVRGPEWTYANQPVTFTVTLRNTGDAPARDTVLALDAAGLAQDARYRQVGTINPGQTRTLNVTVDGGAGDAVGLSAAAKATCVPEGKAADKAVAQIKKIPALLLEAVDNIDPVKAGQDTIYTVAVKNQGNAPAQNVAVTATLPDGFSFVSASGDSDVKADGQNLTFAPVQTLAPGAVVSWAVEAKTSKPASARFKVELKSDSLKRPVPEVEPTRVY